MTLEKDVLEWISEQIKKKRFRSVSHAIEYAIFELMRREKQRKE